MSRSLFFVLSDTSDTRMMTALSDTELILIVVGVFYLSECILWLPEMAVAFSSTFGKLRIANSPVFLRRANSQAALLSPFPWSHCVVAEDSPLAISPDGISILTGPQAGKFISLNLLKSIVADKNFLRLDQATVRFATVSAARHFSAFLQTIQDTPQAERESAIKANAQSRHSLPDLAARLETVERSTSSQRAISTFMFLWIFGYGPFLYYTVEPQPGLLVRYFAPLGIVWLLGIVLFALARFKLFSLPYSEHAGQIATMFFSPAAVMRAAQSITREAFSDFDPSTVAVSCLHPNQLEEFLSKRLRNLKYPFVADFPDASEEFRETCLWHSQLQLSLLQEMLAAENIDVDQLLKPPEVDYGALSWCLRCLAQYTHAEGVCSNCPDLNLQVFENSEPDSTSTSNID